jgi:hypothetical protein
VRGGKECRLRRLFRDTEIASARHDFPPLEIGIEEAPEFGRPFYRHALDHLGARLGEHFRRGDAEAVAIHRRHGAGEAALGDMAHRCFGGRDRGGAPGDRLGGDCWDGGLDQSGREPLPLPAGAGPPTAAAVDG